MWQGTTAPPAPGGGGAVPPGRAPGGQLGPNTKWPYAWDRTQFFVAGERDVYRVTFTGSLKAGFVTERSELGSCRAFRVQYHVLKEVEALYSDGFA